MPVCGPDDHTFVLRSKDNPVSMKSLTIRALSGFKKAFLLTDKVIIIMIISITLYFIYLNYYYIIISQHGVLIFSIEIFHCFLCIVTKISVCVCADATSPQKTKQNQ